MREGYRLRGRGEAPGSIAETGGRGETSEGHVRRDLRDNKGVADMGIRQAWRGKGWGEGGVY